MSSLRVDVCHRRWRTLAALLSGFIVAMATGCASPEAGVAAPPAAAAPTQAPAAAEALAPPASSAAPAASDLDACALLTQDEVEVLADMPLGDPLGAGGPEGAYTLCIWSADPSGPVGQVEIGTGDGAKKFMDIDKDVLKHPFQQLPDIGDEAWLEDGHSFVRVGAMWASITVIRLNDPAENLGRLADATAIVAERMSS